MNNKCDLFTFNNSWYRPAGFLKIFLWYILNRIFLNTYLPLPGIIKVKVLRLFGAKVGKGVVIKPKVNIKYPWFLNISDHVWIGENVWIDNLAPVSIGSNVCVSQGAMLLCGNHNYKTSTFDLMLGEIALEEGCWIGAKAVVCPGVRIKSHAVLSVGSVATKNLDPYFVYSGVPAVKVRERVINQGLAYH